jgi:hypothetical protein
MTDKSPRKGDRKLAGRSLKEKRRDKRAKRERARSSGVS